MRLSKKDTIAGCVITAIMWIINAYCATIGRWMWLSNLGWQRIITSPGEALVIGILMPLFVFGLLWCSQNGRKEI